jgi:hypothetical protein
VRQVSGTPLKILTLYAFCDASGQKGFPARIWLYGIDIHVLYLFQIWILTDGSLLETAGYFCNAAYKSPPRNQMEAPRFVLLPGAGTTGLMTVNSCGIWHTTD